MTTLIGVRTNIGSDAVVIASDTQMSFFDEERNPLSKKTFYKILTGDYWILAHSGDGTEYLRKFCSRITYPDRFKDFDKNIQEEKHEEIKQFYNILIPTYEHYEKFLTQN